MKKIRSALISLSDKSNLKPLLQELRRNNIKIISSGGTFKVIKKLKFKCLDVSDFIGFEEILNGRVKTLHPKIHAGILNKRSSKSHSSDIKKNNFENIDLVIVNFYPFEKILKNQFKSVTYTTTGKETIEKLHENPNTDIILMDLKMPDINGYDATREIRKFNSDVIIIAQTAYGLSSDKDKALEAGCDDYIAKPVNRELLFEKIRDCLDKESI